jgi:probable biosynthetic protein (TIGR04098 family)
MNPTEIEERLRLIVAEVGKMPAAEIDFTKSLDDQGVDSLSLLIFRESCEQEFQTDIPDGAWDGFRSLAQLRDHLALPRGVRAGAGAAPAGPQGPVASPQVSRPPTAKRLDSTSPSEWLEIGMPLMGINNLAEGPLLQRVGDLRWAHVSQYTGVPSKAIVDGDGNRLYATFFYVEVAFPENRPMAAFGENDRVLLVSNMKRFGGSFLDGVVHLVPEDKDPATCSGLDGTASSVAAGIPAVRLSNVFVSQFGGAEWLKKSRPANPGFERIPELAEGPDSYSLVKLAEQRGAFRLPDATYVPMTDGVVETQYQLLADRDVNGAGLVYFANYPVFLDLAEREVLVNARLPVPHELVNRRTLLRRQSAYLNNASWRDVVTIETRIWIQSPFLAGAASPGLAPVCLFTCQRMRRNSDGRLMMVSTAEKVLSGCTMEAMSFSPQLGFSTM